MKDEFRIGAFATRAERFPPGTEQSEANLVRSANRSQSGAILRTEANGPLSVVRCPVESSARFSRSNRPGTSACSVSTVEDGNDANRDADVTQAIPKGST